MILDLALLSKFYIIHILEKPLAFIRLYIFQLYLFHRHFDLIDLYGYWAYLLKHLKKKTCLFKKHAAVLISQYASFYYTVPLGE